ncbi:6-hydroxymethylpterin diphosphokinase MptE-like protein [Halogeometricum sp. CBA1124]|uniref:6-hydroxymethylpterin diphosphokinase MptE-like protein n=1 Tax=Halogeometricum sp. CBA1124 TaxID=2668071 RepID=UPI001429F578|nr:6-hydroxymethylpterin diphosphokinase MptE-like protein [Halogeometricum sp. CBA1124]MUV58764.1 DUF115 domain-containing protein [Halogeometricum sp. CBA1124]
MEFLDWDPVYELILDDFGYPREGDERARDVMAAYARPFDADRLDCTGRTVAVVGAAPSLSDEVDAVADAGLVFAASTAADVVREAGYEVDLMVTDLDKNPETALRRTRAGRPVAAHAHGDNVPAIREWFPRFDADHVLATTQAEPVDGVVNHGGFTDGDRAAFLADAFGAADLRFVGWEFDDPTVGAEKAKKLRWAERLLYWLERRRGDRFAVLDGRRDAIEPL